jgi:hypothetical protein
MRVTVSYLCPRLWPRTQLVCGPEPHADGSPSSWSGIFAAGLRRVVPGCTAAPHHHSAPPPVGIAELSRLKIKSGAAARRRGPGSRAGLCPAGSARRTPGHARRARRPSRAHPARGPVAARCRPSRRSSVLLAARRVNGGPCGPSQAIGCRRPLTWRSTRQGWAPIRKDGEESRLHSGGWAGYRRYGGGRRWVGRGPGQRAACRAPRPDTP